MRRALFPVLAVAGLAAAALLTRGAPPAPRPLPAPSLRTFREDLKRDPTLAGAILGLSREEVMATASMTPAEKEALWRQVQQLQAEARAHGTAPVVTVEDTVEDE